MSQIVTGTVVKVYRNVGGYAEGTEVWEEVNVATGQPVMHPDESALLAAIVADPDDDTARLVYADWLQENGREERAEFIRVQVELARLPEPEELTIGVIGTQDQIARATCRACRKLAASEWCEFHSLQRRERELIQDHGYGWCDGLLGEAKARTRGVSKDAITCVVDYIFPTGRGTNAMWLAFRRGFIERVEMPAACWAEHGDAIGANQPVTRAVLLTEPEDTENWHRVGDCYKHPRWPGVTFQLPGGA